MATIIQKPDTLSLSRNLKELIISTSSEISLQLLKGDSMLLEETYLPDVNNRVHVNLADIVTSSLSLTMPSGDAVSTFQSSVYSDFTVKVDGTSVAEFTAVRSGVERFSDTAANFLTANWLTWQPQVKEVLHDQPEWLTYYPASGSCACYARFYYTDGTSGEIKVCDVSQCVSINTRFSKLWALDESGKERYGVIDVYIKDAQGLRLTYVQRYVLCSQGALDEVYLCENSLGGLDTFLFYGDRKLVPEIGYTSLLLDNSYTAADPDLYRKWSQNTGMLTGRECEWCWELFRSSAAYHLYRGTILPIVLDASSVEKSAMSVLAAYSFDYRYASDLGLLNVVRSENLPEVVEVSGPDAEVFFLTPRLNEFPSAVLSDDLIIPVQSPYEESWYTLSVGGLKSALLSSVETIYGPMWHEHDNLQVLNGLSVDSSGNLLYNGVQVGSGIVGAHDHHGETIRPEKIVVGTVEITCVDGRLHVSSTVTSDGDFVAFGDEAGGEAGGGLDVARLWEELAAADASKVIDVSHIPDSVVLQDELTEILDEYLPTADWVKEELAKYVTIAGNQDITGVKTFVNGIKIGSITLSVVDGRLHVSSTVTSDGDFVAFGDEEGSTGSGGLDVDRMWEELEAEGTEQIHASHLTDALSGYATQDYVNNRINDLINGAPAAYDTLKEIADVLEGNVDSIGDILTALGVKADKATTLEGYGITDAYTKTQIDEELAKYVTLAGNQDITGVKTFTNGIKIGDVGITCVDGRLHFSATATSDGDFVAFGDEEGGAGGGLDADAMWAELRAQDGSKVIDITHIPSIPVDKVTGLSGAVSTITTENLTASRALVSNALGKVAVSAVTATELGYLDGVTSNIQSQLNGKQATGSYMTTNTEQNVTASKTVIGKPWAVRMSVDTSNSVDGFIWKNVSGSQIAGLTYHNTVRRIFINANYIGVQNVCEDTAGKYSLRVGWGELTYNSYPIMRSDNIGSYALTPSNYTSYLDSRYVNVSGDTMTGPLTLPSITGSYSLKIGTLGGIQCDSTFGAVLQYESTFINVTNSGLKRNNSYTIWDSGNDGSGSGLDADTVDGTHSWNLFITNAGGLSSSQLDTFVNRQSGTYNVSYSGHSRTLTVFRGTGSSSAIELLSHYAGQLWCRWTIDSNRYNEAGFREFAFTDSNVASATRLQTARSLWGNSFDGGQNLTGRIWAYDGINIGSLNDYGWFNSSNRISCGLNTARGCNVGSLLVSNAWADATMVPYYGIYSKGNILSAGNIIAYSSSSRLVKDIVPHTSYQQKLQALGRMVDYRYNNILKRDKELHTGLIYENVKVIMPSMCYMHEGYGALNYLDTDYINLIAGSVQEHTDEIAHLKNKVASLEAEVARLRRGLAA